MIRRRLLPFAVLATVALPAAGATAATSVIDLPKFAAKAVAKAKRSSDVPILLPDKLTLPDRKARFGASAVVIEDPEVVAIDVGFGKNCGGAGACSYASFTAEPGGRRDRSLRKKVKLTGGLFGYYRPTECGANCSGPSIQFIREKVLYTFTVERADRGAEKAMVAMANQALRAGPR